MATTAPISHGSGRRPSSPEQPERPMPRPTSNRPPSARRLLGTATAVAATLLGGLLGGCAAFAPLPEPTTLETRLADFPTAGLDLEGPVAIQWDAHQIPFVEAAQRRRPRLRARPGARPSAPRADGDAAAGQPGPHRGDRRAAGGRDRPRAAHPRPRQGGAGHPGGDAGRQPPLARQVRRRHQRLRRSRRSPRTPAARVPDLRHRARALDRRRRSYHRSAGLGRRLLDRLVRAPEGAGPAGICGTLGPAADGRRRLRAQFRLQRRLRRRPRRDPRPAPARPAATRSRCRPPAAPPAAR